MPTRLKYFFYLVFHVLLWGHICALPSINNPFKFYNIPAEIRIQNISIPRKNFTLSSRQDYRFSFEIKKTKGDFTPRNLDRFFTYSFLKNGERIFLDAKTSFIDNRFVVRTPFFHFTQTGSYDLKIHFKTPFYESEALKKNALQIHPDKINLIFIVDNSGSMLNNDPKAKRFYAISEVLNKPYIRANLNRIAVISFSDWAEIILDFSPADQRTKIEKSFTKFRRFKNTDIPGAFRKAETLIEKAGRIRGKTAVIFLTDGISSIPWNEEHSAFIKAGIPVYCVGLSGENRKDYNKFFLEKISTQTGGKFFPADNFNIRQVYRDIISYETKQKERIIFYPVKNTYFNDECIVIKMKWTQENAEGKIHLTANHKTLPLLYQKKSRGYLKQFYQPPDKGYHLLEINASAGRHARKKIRKKIQIKGKQNFFEISKPVVFKRLEPFAFSSRSITLRNLTPQKHSMNMFPSSLFFSNKNSRKTKVENLSSKTDIISANAVSISGIPFLLEKNETQTKTVSIGINEMKPGAYSGYIFLETESGVFPVEISGIVKKNKSWTGADFLIPPERKSTVKKIKEKIVSHKKKLIHKIIFDTISVIYTIWIAVIATVFFIWRPFWKRS